MTPRKLYIYPDYANDTAAAHAIEYLRPRLRILWPTTRHRLLNAAAYWQLARHYPQYVY